MLRKIVKVIKRIFLSILFLILSGAVLICYAVKIEPYLIAIETITFQTEFSKIINIVQVSDIQIREEFTTGNLKKVINTINAQKPDIVLFTGDLYENYAKYHSNEALVELLSAIETKYGKFAVWGNRDYGGGAVREYETIMEQCGFQLLRNEAASIMLNDKDKLFLAGLDDALLGKPDIESILEEFQQEENQYSILMTHEPDVADLYADVGFDLIVSGHSHGGQVNIPFLPHMTTVMAEKYVKGIYRLNANTNLYVNSGIGTSRYPIRFGVLPEITVLALEKED